MRKWSCMFYGMGLLFLAAALLLILYNMQEDYRAQDISNEILEVFYEDLPETQPVVLMQNKIPAKPNDGWNSKTDMPVKYIESRAYVGVLEIEALSLSLPVLDDWSYPKLKIAPCRYYGSVYQDNLVIMAHNYVSHFGKLKNLSLGDTIIFTDVDGNVFSYQVASIEIYKPLQVEAMISGEWDLTLFTCTIGGKSRVTICCERM